MDCSWIYDEQSTGRSLWAKAFARASTAAWSLCLLALVSSTSFGFCRHGVSEINQFDARSMLGLSEEQARLTPAAYWVYKNGIIGLSFLKPVVPCDGPNCNSEPARSKSLFSTGTRSSGGPTTAQGLAANALTKHAHDSDPCGYFTSADLRYLNAYIVGLDRPPIVRG